MAVVGQFGLVNDRAVLDQSVTTMGQGQQSRDAWDSAGRLAWSDAVCQVFAAVAFFGDVELSIDGEGFTH